MWRRCYHGVAPAVLYDCGTVAGSGLPTNATRLHLPRRSLKLDLGDPKRGVDRNGSQAG